MWVKWQSVQCSLEKTKKFRASKQKMDSIHLDVFVLKVVVFFSLLFRLSFDYYRTYIIIRIKHYRLPNKDKNRINVDHKMLFFPFNKSQFFSLSHLTGNKLRSHIQQNTYYTFHFLHVLFSPSPFPVLFVTLYLCLLVMAKVVTIFNQMLQWIYNLNENNVFITCQPNANEKVPLLPSYMTVGELLYVKTHSEYIRDILHLNANWSMYGLSWRELKERKRNGTGVRALIKYHIKY